MDQTLDFQVPASGQIYKEAVEVSGFTKSNIPKDSIHIDLAKPVTIKAPPGNPDNFRMVKGSFLQFHQRAGIHIVNAMPQGAKIRTVSSEALPIGLKQEIVRGPAQIICSIDGEPRYYDIEILCRILN